MKYSIRKKMFLIALATTTLSFFLILICFNAITSRHIEQQSLMELSQAAMRIDPAVSIRMNDKTTVMGIDPIVSFPMDNETAVSWNVSAFQSSPAAAFTPSTRSAIDTSSGDSPSADIDLTVEPCISAVSISGIASYISTSLYTEDTAMEDVQFILTDPNDSALVYPAEDTLTISTAAEASQPLTALPLVNFSEIRAIQSYAGKLGASAPQKIVLNGSSYYIIESKINDQANAILYKNVQPLEDLASEVNLALLILLILSSLATIALSMGLSNGMVRSIQKLCSFANSVGSGNLIPQELGLKEKELAVLEQDMNNMAKKLAAHDAQQKTFFQNVSHELRTPLMTIQGYAEGISERIFEGPEMQNAAEIILAASDRLTEMIQNLLCLSRMDSRDRNEKNESFDVIELLHDTADQCRSLTDHAVVVLEEDQHSEASSESKGFPLFGCREDLQKALLNILVNAVRYAKTQITISCRPDQRLIRIADDGPGIAETDLPHIFERFYKGAGGCSGIGLAIAETAIRKMNGFIEAHNENGAVFTITFPVETDPNEPPLPL